MRPIRLLLLVSLCLVACGATQREQLVKTTLVTVNEARDSFVAFDNTAQQAIVAAAPTYERGYAALLVYRKRREVVVEAFAAAYRAIAMAATANDELTIPTMLSAARTVAEALKSLKEAGEP